MVIESDILAKLTQKCVEAIKSMQDATSLNSLLAGDRMVRLMETSSDKQKILLCGRINDRFKQRNFL
jgi:hypothetical protein